MIIKILSIVFFLAAWRFLHGLIIIFASIHHRTSKGFKDFYGIGFLKNPTPVFNLINEALSISIAARITYGLFW